MKTTDKTRPPTQPAASEDLGPTLDDASEPTPPPFSVLPDPGESRSPSDESLTPPAAERLVITADELKKIAALIRQLGAFKDQIFNLTGHFAAQRTAVASRQYLAAPSSETFEALKAAAIAEGLIERSVLSPTVKATVEGTRDTFISEQALPLATSILKRCLAAFERDLHEITEQENALHLEHFGTPVGSSAKIEQAAQRISQVERLLRDAARNFSVETAQEIYEYLQTLPSPNSEANPG